jgi:uncharacterized protein involved in cysteine biosynthesis
VSEIHKETSLKLCKKTKNKMLKNIIGLLTALIPTIYTFHFNLTAKFTNWKQVREYHELALPKYQILVKKGAEKKEKLLWTKIV